MAIGTMRLSRVETDQVNLIGRLTLRSSIARGEPEVLQECVGTRGAAEERLDQLQGLGGGPRLQYRSPEAEAVAQRGGRQVVSPDP